MLCDDYAIVMKSTTSRLALIFFSLSSLSHGAIIFTLSPGPNGGVSVVGTGSGMTTGALTTDDFDYANLGTFLNAASTVDTLIDAEIAGGTFTNITSGISQPIDGFQVDRDATSSDDVDFDTVADLAFAAGDSYSIDLTATFEASTLPFSSLILGSSTKQGTGSGDEVFGDVTVNVVPEPSSAVLFLSGLLAMVARRRRP